MAARNLLHRSKLNEFKKWLYENYGDIELSPVGQYEVMRLSDGRYGEPMKIIFNGKSKEHFSCNEASIKYVVKFTKETSK